MLPHVIVIGDDFGALAGSAAAIPAPDATIASTKNPKRNRFTSFSPSPIAATVRLLDAAEACVLRSGEGATSLRGHSKPVVRPHSSRQFAPLR